MKQIGIIGSGAAGLLLLHNFEKNGIDPRSITIIDHTHMGGDIKTKWMMVKSNTTWRQIMDAVPSSFCVQEPWSLLDPDQPCQLRYIIDYLLKATECYRSQCSLRTDHVESAIHEEGKWKVSVKHKSTPFCFNLLFCTQGSECKSLDLPFPSIPLPIALNESLLKECVKPQDHVLLFGTAHSSTLIVKHLTSCGATITNIYASPQPFYFDRHGDYDGLKQEAASIADDILANKYTNLELISIQDTASIIRTSKKAKYCIYAIGFEPRLISQCKDYDKLTGRLTIGPNAWGFGIAYPNQASDGIHFDVSVPAFQAHIQRQMPDILSSLTIE